MKIRILFFLNLAVTVCLAQIGVSIIPQPVIMKVNSGNFIIDARTAIQFNSNQKELKSAADFLTTNVKNISGYSLQINVAKQKVIQLMIVEMPQIGDEGYQMDVTTTSVTIKANTKSGIIYGIQSLLQTLPAIRTNAILQIPCMNITDYPRFKYRGMHLDESRHFFGPDGVKEYINLMASYKMNTFHWHLVDDQGWRIEIKKYPKLTSVGAWRVDHNDKVWGSRPQAKPGEEATYGGYYSQ